MENLKLPLCPKCGDTRFVMEDRGYRMSQKLQPNYYCNQCSVVWSSIPYRLRDEHGKEYQVR